MAVTNPLVGQYGLAYAAHQTGHPTSPTTGGWFAMKITDIVGPTKAWECEDDNKKKWNVTANKNRGVIVTDENTAKAIWTARKKQLSGKKSRNMNRLDDMNMIFLDLKGVVRKVFVDGDNNVTFSSIENEQINEGVYFYLRKLIRAADNSSEEEEEKSQKKKKKKKNPIPSVAVIASRRSVDDDDMEENEKLDNKIVKKSSGGGGTRKSSRGSINSTRDNLKDLSDSEDDEDGDEIVKKGSGGGTGKSSRVRKSAGGKVKDGKGGEKLMAEELNSDSDEDDESGGKIKEQLEKLEEENKELWDENEKLAGNHKKLQNDYDLLDVEYGGLEREKDELKEEQKMDKRSMEKLKAEVEQLKGERVVNKSIQEHSSKREEKMQKRIEQLQEQLQQQKQPSEQPPQQQSIIELLQKQLQQQPQEQQKQTQQRQQQVIIDLVRTMINSCGYGDAEVGIMERMEAKFSSVKVSSVESPTTTIVHGPAVQIINALVLVAKEEKYSLLQDKLQEELEDLDKFIPDLKQLAEKVVKEENVLKERVALCAQLEKGKGGLTAEARAGLIQECETDVAKAKDEYSTKEATVRRHHKRIATEMEGENENATTYTKWKKMERRTPDLLARARTSWEDSLKFETWKSSISTRLEMSAEESSSETE